MRRRALRGYAAPEWADRTHAGTRGALPAPPPSASGLFASFAEREHALHIGAMCTPAAFVRLLIDDEVVLQRRSLSPVARRMAASVPTGTVSESLPATVTIREPSGLSQVSCEPAWRCFDPPLSPQCPSHIPKLLC